MIERYGGFVKVEDVEECDKSPEELLIEGLEKRIDGMATMDNFWLHANSLSAICGSLRLDPNNRSISNMNRMIKCIEHLTAMNLVLLHEVEKLKKEKENA